MTEPPGPRARPSDERLAIGAPPVALVAILLGAWEVYAGRRGSARSSCRRRRQVIEALWDVPRAGRPAHVPTLIETVVGFACRSWPRPPSPSRWTGWRGSRRAVEPLLVGSQTIPIVAIAPLVVVWFGFGLLPKVLVVVLVTFFPITIALLGGFASTTSEASDLMRSLGASAGRRSARCAGRPACRRFFTGLRISATYGVVAAVIGEYVGATDGPGHLDAAEPALFRTDLVFAAILLTAVLSVALYSLVVVAERATIPWWHAARAGASAGTRPIEA